MINQRKLKFKKKLVVNLVFQPNAQGVIYSIEKVRKKSWVPQDHPRSPKVTQDPPILPRITQDHQRSQNIPKYAKSIPKLSRKYPNSIQKVSKKYPKGIQKVS